MGSLHFVFSPEKIPCLRGVVNPPVHNLQKFKLIMGGRVVPFEKHFLGQSTMQGGGDIYSINTRMTNEMFLKGEGTLFAHV